MFFVFLLFVLGVCLNKDVGISGCGDYFMDGDDVVVQERKRGKQGREEDDEVDEEEEKRVGK